MTLTSSLYVGQVYHRRTRPKEHKLRYSVFTLLLDLSEIDSLAQKHWLFSRNGFNLFSFRDRDFGEQRHEKLQDYVNRKLGESGIYTVPSQILLSCYPVVLGYVFNPLSLFYCIDEEGCCFAVVHEVHNTFGERHAYVLPVTRDVDQNDGWIHQQAGKQLFVSPFAHMGMRYQFRLNQPKQRQVVVIRASDEDGLLITASYTADRKAISTARLLRYFFIYPFQSAKVVLGIHWEALRLYVKGVPWFKHQPKSTN